MNENTLLRINNIRDKILALHSALVLEKDNNKKLQLEVSDLKKMLSAVQTKEKELNASLDNVKQEMIAAQNQGIKPHQITGKSDEEIDELIDEIEFCIEQLKK